MKELAEANRHIQSEEAKAETWEYLKTKKDFSEFLDFEDKNIGYSLDELEALMPRSAAVAEYMKWFKNFKNKYIGQIKNPYLFSDKSGLFFVFSRIGIFLFFQ